MWDTIGVIAAVFIIIGIWSLAFWGTSIISRIVENIYVGVTTGYGIVLAIQYLLRTAYAPITEGNLLRLIPVLIGLLVYSRFIPGYAWLMRYPLAIMAALGIGLALRTTINVSIVKQIQPTITAIVNYQEPIDLFNGILIALFTITTLVYFVFMGSVAKQLEPVRRISRISMMVAFGSAYAGAVAYRANLNIGRQLFLWAPENQLISFAVIAVIILILVVEKMYKK